jgi:hypothetical protein
MKAIHKYPIPVHGRFQLEAPADFNALSVGIDGHGALCLWALVDPKSPPFTSIFNIVFTGEELAETSYHVRRGVDKWKFIGTVTLEHGIVSHVFQEV